MDLDCLRYGMLVINIIFFLRIFIGNFDFFDWRSVFCNFWVIWDWIVCRSIELVILELDGVFDFFVV